MFWTGILLIILFASMLPIFPVSDMRTAGASELGWAGALDVLHHLVLPACTLGFVYLAQYSRLARASVIEALSADHPHRARQGLPERAVLHALRNGVLPVTMLGLQFGNAGRRHPGRDGLQLARPAGLDSVLRRDYPTLLGILLFASLLVVVMNQLTDLAYRLVDPGSRHHEPDSRRAPGAASAVSVSSVSSQPPWRRRCRHVAARRSASRAALRAFLRNPRPSSACCWPPCWRDVFGPALMPGDPFEIVSAPMEPPGAEFLLGTDPGARRADRPGSRRPRHAAGGRGGGGAVGADRGDGGRAGRLLRRLDRRALMRVTEFFQVLPTLLFAMVLVTLFSPSLATIAIAIGVVSWTGTARLARGEFLRLKRREYVLAERVIGAGDARIIWRVILPNALAPLIVSATLAVGTAVLFEAGLSFLGLGDPNVMSWG